MRFVILCVLLLPTLALGQSVVRPAKTLGVVSATSLTTTGNVLAGGTVTGSNLSGTNTGNVTLTAVGSSPSANGASLSGQALTLQPADATRPGVVTTGTQTFAGAKTFSSAITGTTLQSGGTSAITLTAASPNNGTVIVNNTGTMTGGYPFEVFVNDVPQMFVDQGGNVGAATYATNSGATFGLRGHISGVPADGASDCAQLLTLSSGVATASTTCVTASSHPVCMTVTPSGSVGVPVAKAADISAGVSYKITSVTPGGTSTQTGDNSTVFCYLIN